MVTSFSLVNNVTFNLVFYIKIMFLEKTAKYIFSFLIIGLLFSIAQISFASTLNSKVITITRNLNSATGDVSYTGIGFQPSSLITNCSIDGNGPKISWGMTDKNKDASHVVEIGTEVYGDGNIYAINLVTTLSTNFQKALVKSYDVDGFTLTWTKTGSPTGTGSCAIIAYGITDTGGAGTDIFDPAFIWIIEFSILFSTFGLIIWFIIDYFKKFNK